MQAEYFVENLATNVSQFTSVNVTQAREPWFYSLANDSYAVVGQAKKFVFNNKVKLDMLTVKVCDFPVGKVVCRAAATWSRRIAPPRHYR